MAELILSENGDIIVTVSTLAKVLGVSSEKTITNYVKKGMPFIKKGKQRTYGVKECLQWAYANGHIALDLNIDADINVEDIAPAVRKDLADARLKELKLQKEKEEVILKSDVINDASSFGIALRDNLMSIPSRIANSVADEIDPKEIIKMLNTELRQSLEDVISEFME